MLRYLVLFNFLAVGALLKADADIGLIQEFVGTYPVVEYLGNTLAAGKAEIFVSETEVGVKLLPLKLSSHPMPALVISSPRNNTVLRRDAKGIYQTYENGAEQARIDYIFAEGYLVIDASQCGLDHCVKDTTLSLSRGGAPGTKIDTAEFLSKVHGNYKVEWVAGEPPHGEETNTAEWVESEEPGVEFLRFPYCQPTGCDPGFLNINRDDLSIYQNGPVYTLMVKAGSKWLHLSWEDKGNGKFVFTNYQFKLLTKETVALEYEVQKVPTSFSENGYLLFAK